MESHNQTEAIAKTAAATTNSAQQCSKQAGHLVSSINASQS